MAKLTDKQKKFATEYLIDLNAAQAAIRTGYSSNTAKEQASRLLTNVNIKKYIEKRIETDLGDTTILIGRVIKELQKISFADIDSYMTWDEETGTIIPSKDVDTAALSQVVITEKNLKSEKDTELVQREIKFKMHDKIKALDILSKYLDLYTNTIELNVPIALNYTGNIKPDIKKKDGNGGNGG